jgi:hypothetical protein
MHEDPLALLVLLHVPVTLMMVADVEGEEARHIGELLPAGLLDQVVSEARAGGNVLDLGIFG